MDFQKLTLEKIKEVASPFFKEQTTRMSVYSSAYQFMWSREIYSPDFCVEENCLILKGSFHGVEYFYYPISKGGDRDEEERAIKKIEEYCRANYKTLRFINVPKDRVGELCARYSLGMHVETVRTWNDYLYLTEEFKTFPGKKFGGQRNHVNKFYKLYPDAKFHVFQSGDEKKLLHFLKEFENTQFKKTDAMAKKELALAKEMVEKITEFNLCCGYMEVGGKVVSFAAGEVCGNTIMEHLEKALKEYQGVYPATAQAFVQTFAGEGVTYLNREDDSGDLGLRKSKLQYNPCELLQKYSVVVDKPLARVKSQPTIRGERVTLKKITAKEQDDYFRLASDIERNKWWGYDYRDGLKGKKATPEYFLSVVRRDFKNRNEMALGIYLKSTLVGEAVLHNLGYTGEVEVGARVLSEFEGQGYAREAIRLLSDFAFIELGAERVQAKCFKENVRSKKMLEGAGLKACGEDEKYFYFFRTPTM